MHKMIIDDAFGGEVVAIIDVSLLGKMFTHQLDHFRDGSPLYRPDYFLSVNVCIAVWINESYREDNPPPLDVEECFQSWEHNTIGIQNQVVNYDALRNCFQGRNREGQSKAALFEECTYCR